VDAYRSRGHIVDYGRVEVASDDMGVEQALMVALREMRDMLATGWPYTNAAGVVEQAVPQFIFVDAGYQSPVVYAFCREAGERFRPAVGRGVAQQRNQNYHRPTQTGSIVRCIGEGYYASWLPAEQLHLVEVHADQWKSWVHQRLATPLGKPGAIPRIRGLPHRRRVRRQHRWNVQEG
jgi:hypothetical protein